MKRQNLLPKIKGTEKPNHYQQFQLKVNVVIEINKIIFYIN
jgi:hypothetical protein